MIICTHCGHQNDDGDTFCGSCGGFLEYVGERVVLDDEPPEPEPQPSADAHAGLIERVKDRIGLGDARTSDSTAEPAVGSPAPSPVSADNPATTQASVAPAPVESRKSGPPAWASPAPLAPAFGLVPPSVKPASAPERPAAPPAAMPPLPPEAVKPTVVKVPYTPQTKVAPSRVVNPGDLVCGQCGEGNDPARHFCRRCSASLQRAQTFTLPWYRRLWRKLTSPRARRAGERPRTRRRAVGGGKRGWLSSGVTKVIVVVLIAFAVVANVGPWKTTIRDHLTRYYHDVSEFVHPTYNAVHPVSAVATTSAPGHGADKAIDGLTNTSWQTDSSNDGVGQTLTLHLDPASNIDKIGFLNGDQDTPQAYLTEPRLETVTLEFLAQPGKTALVPYGKTLTLTDTASFQTYTVSAKIASVVRITIDSVYSSVQGGTHAAIAEVELFQES